MISTAPAFLSRPALAASRASSWERRDVSGPLRNRSALARLSWFRCVALSFKRLDLGRRIHPGTGGLCRERSGVAAARQRRALDPQAVVGATPTDVRLDARQSPRDSVEPTRPQIRPPWRG